MTKPALLFIYNASGGFFHVAADMAHKIFSPSTYPCSLCQITYGTFKIRDEWKHYLEKLPIEKKFYHKEDCYTLPLPQPLALPAILYQPTPFHNPQLFITAQELNACKHIKDITSLLDQRLEIVNKADGLEEIGKLVSP